MASQKCWAILIITFVCVFIVYSPYISSAYHLLLHSSINDIQSDVSLQQALQQLIKSPVVGPLFYQQLIRQSAANNEWQKVLVYANQAITKEINAYKFIIWYYKALAECLKGEKELCGSSARIASGLTKGASEHNLRQIFQLIDLIEQAQQGRFSWVTDAKGTTVITRIPAVESIQKTKEIQSNDQQSQNTQISIKQELSLSQL